MKSRTRTQYRAAQTALALAWLITASVAIQVFLAGLALFDSASRWTDHRTFGMMIGPMMFLLVLAVLLARPTRSLVIRSIALLALYLVQINLPDASPGWIAALHPLVGFAILGLPMGLARGLRRALRAWAAEPTDGGASAARRTPVRDAGSLP